MPNFSSLALKLWEEIEVTGGHGMQPMHPLFLLLVFQLMQEAQTKHHK